MSILFQFSIKLLAHALCLMSERGRYRRRMDKVEEKMPQNFSRCQE